MIIIRRIGAVLAVLLSLTATTGAQAALERVDSGDDSAYAGTVDFGRYVDTTDGYTIIGANAGLSATTYDPTLEVEAANLLALPGVPSGITDLLGVAMGPFGGPFHRAALFVYKGPDAFLMTFRRIVILGTPTWLFESETPVGSGQVTYPQIVWGEDRPLTIAYVENDTILQLRSFDTSGPAVTAQIIHPGSHFLTSIGIRSLDVADRSNEVPGIVNVAIGFAIFATAEEPVATFSNVFDVDAFTVVGVFENPDGGLFTGFGKACAFAGDVPGFGRALFVGAPGQGSGRVHTFSLSVTGVPLLISSSPLGPKDPETEPEEFGRALAVDATGTVLAVAERQNEFWPPAPGLGGNYAGLVRLFRVDYSQFGVVLEGGEVLQNFADPGAPFLDFGIDMDFGIVANDTYLLAGAPGGSAASLLPVADDSWVEADVSPGLAAGPYAPELCVQAGLYGIPDAAPGPVKIVVEDGSGPAGAPSFIVIGVSAIAAPFKGGVLYPSPDLLLNVPLDASGGFGILTGWNVDAAAAGPFDLFLQAWIATGSGFASTPAWALHQD